MDDNEEEIHTLVIMSESGEHICDVDLDKEQFSALVRLGLMTLLEDALND